MSVFPRKLPFTPRTFRGLRDIFFMTYYANFYENPPLPQEFS